MSAPSDEHTRLEPASPQSEEHGPGLAGKGRERFGTPLEAGRRRQWYRLWHWMERAGSSHLAGLVRLGGVGRGEAATGPFAATRRRLIATNVVVVAVVLALLSAVVYVFNVQAGQQEIDAQLQHYATFGVSAAHNNPLPPENDDGSGPPGGIQGSQPFRPPYSPASPDLFTVVLDPSGHVRVDDDNVLSYGVPVVAAARPVLRGEQPHLSTTVRADGHIFRLYITTASQDEQVAAVVVEGISLDVQDQQQLNLVRTLALLYVVVLLLTFLSSLYLAERALRPARLAFLRQRQFASAASHELRTPLAVIRSEAELASALLGDALAAARARLDRQHAPAPDDVTAPIEEALGETRAVAAEVDFMTRMANGLLLLARDEADARAHTWTAVDLRAIVEEAAAKVRPLAERAGLSLRVGEHGANASSEIGPLWVRGDPSLLRQLAFNLLDNAVRYTLAGGSISVAVRGERRVHVPGDLRRHATVTISDTGVGIAAEHLDHIFEPFYRALSTRPPRDAEVGTGLGLALAQWIVRAHGGSVAVQSAVGQGTTVTVELPLAAAPTLS
ncbi:MAG TPA: HAMP domain-containing sensor histidine kinase [Ktedonobacterales bacterium]